MTLVYLVVLVPVIFGFVSLGLDLGHVEVVKQELEHASEAGARAAVMQLSNGITATQNAAVLWGGYNTADGSAVVIDPNNDVAFGTWNTSTRTFTTLSGSARTGANAVCVSAHHTAARGNPVDLVFGHVVGMASCDTNSSTTCIGSVVQVNYPSGFSGSGSSLDYNGSAYLSGSSIVLTNGGASQAGSVWYNTKVPIANFTAYFIFQISAGSSTADGFTFCLQSDGTSQLGAVGGGLGYAGIANSLCVKFDLYNNSGEGSDSTGVFTGGANPYNVGSVDLSSTGINLHSGHTFIVGIGYYENSLIESITDLNTDSTWVTTYSVNLPSVLGSNSAYVGFTAGTGGLTATQQISYLTYQYNGSTIVQVK